ncbi:MAG TPA: hypothetical protein VK570_19945, partial [Rubrivivax sp.]|nr:hypothetical protein [Rubrivivax sp.]
MAHFGYGCTKPAKAPQRPLDPMPSAPRILYITPANPFSAASGAEQRSAILLMALQAVGTVDVLVLAPGPGTRIWREPDDGDGVWRGEVRDGGGLLRYRPKPPLTHELESALGRTIDSYALVVGRYLWSLCQLVLPASVRTLVDLDDFRYRYGAQAGWSPSLVKERLAKAVNFQLARRQLHRFDAAFVVSERDKALLGGMPCLLLTNVPWKMPSQVAPLPTDKCVLFVGSLWYRPNADGIDWFLARVWPIV